MEVVDIAPIPAADGALGQTGFREQDNAPFVEILFDAQPVTATAGSRRVVEGKQSGFEFVDAVATLGAGEARREHDVLAVAVHVADGGEAIGQAQGGLERFGQADAQIVTYLEAIHHHLDAVLFLLVQFRYDRPGR